MDKKTSKIKEEKPDYIRIYHDLIKNKFPDRLEDFEDILSKEEISCLDVKLLNKKLFGIKDKENLNSSQRYNAYNKQTILQILRHKDKYQLNFTQTARHFTMSRNTLYKWQQLMGHLV